MTIDTSYFEGELSLGQITSPAVLAAVNLFIQKYETELLTRLLGYELYTEYKNGIVAPTPLQKWIDIRDGKEYTDNSGLLNKWHGLRFSNGFTITNTQFTAPITFKIGDGGVNTPAAGGKVYTNTALAGLTNIDIALFRAGFIKYPVQDYNVNSGGGFTLSITEDVFTAGEEFILFVQTPQTVSTPGSGTLKLSPIANYVYYHYLKDNVSFTMGAGEVKTKSNTSDNVTPYPKMVRAWNEMVDWNRDLVSFLEQYPAVYGTYDPIFNWPGYFYNQLRFELLTYKNRML